MPDKYLIVGLGNAGKTYADTRHNIGFMTVDTFAVTNSCSFKKSKLFAYIAQTDFVQKSVILAKPTTFMNNSGQAVLAVKNYYHIETEHILIVYDDADLPLGKIRMREKGGAGGHKGMASIINCLASLEIPRLRLGIRSEYGRSDMVDFVLSSFGKSEQNMVSTMIQKACEAIELFITTNIHKTMTIVNTREQ